MIRLYLLFFLALLILVVPKESAGQNGNFTEMSETFISVPNLSRCAKKLGLDKTSIKNQALVLLRSKLPRLLVKDSAVSGVYVSVYAGPTKTVGGNTVGYFGYVSVGVSRNVTITKTGLNTAGFLWYNTLAIRGTTSTVMENVRISLDQLITEFAAAWYRDNPSK